MNQELKLFSISPIGIMVPMKVVSFPSAPPIFRLPLADVPGIGNSIDILQNPPRLREATFARIRKMDGNSWMYVLTDEN